MGNLQVLCKYITLSGLLKHKYINCDNKKLPLIFRMYQMRIRTTIQSATILAGSSPIRELLCFYSTWQTSPTKPFWGFLECCLLVVEHRGYPNHFGDPNQPVLHPNPPPMTRGKKIYITITSTQGILIMPQHSHKHVLESDVGIISSLSRQRWCASQVVDAVESKYASINVDEKASIYTQGTSYSGHSLYPPT